MNVSDRMHEAVQNILDRMSYAEREEWMEKFMEAKDFEEWLYDQLYARVEEDKRSSEEPDA